MQPAYNTPDTRSMGSSEDILKLRMIGKDICPENLPGVRILVVLYMLEWQPQKFHFWKKKVLTFLVSSNWQLLAWRRVLRDMEYFRTCIFSIFKLVYIAFCLAEALSSCFITPYNAMIIQNISATQATNIIIGKELKYNQVIKFNYKVNSAS